MSEWTVQKVRYVSAVIYSTDDSYIGRHCIECNKELWYDFDLTYKHVIARINSILDTKGRIIATIGENTLLECKKMSLKNFIMTDGIVPPERYEEYYLLIFSRDFVKQYGLRRGECVDLVLQGISNSSQRIEMKEEIYPKRFITGRIDVQPSGSKPNPIGITEPLIEQTILDDFYKELIQEINLAYSYQLYRSTIVMVRKLLENLLIDLLRTRYGTQKVELFYNTERNQFLDFYYLIENLKKSKADFAPFTSGFDSEFFNFINRFRENANSNAHALEAFIDKDQIKNDKTKINHYIKIIKNTIELIKKSS